MLNSTITPSILLEPILFALFGQKSDLSYGSGISMLSRTDMRLTCAVWDGMAASSGLLEG